jgi:orotate phosphoribosyltransferase-like protein
LKTFLWLSHRNKKIITYLLKKNTKKNEQSQGLDFKVSQQNKGQNTERLHFADFVLKFLFVILYRIFLHDCVELIVVLIVVYCHNYMAKAFQMIKLEGL